MCKNEPFLIIYGEHFANHRYHEFCCEDRREGLSQIFQQNDLSRVQTPVSKKQDESILPRLRNLSQYSVPLACTERFKRSFVLILCAVFWRIFLKIFLMILLT